MPHPYTPTRLIVAAIAFMGMSAFASVAPAQDACCLPDGSCVDVNNFEECEALGGFFPGRPTMHSYWLRK